MDRCLGLEDQGLSVDSQYPSRNVLAIDKGIFGLNVQADIATDKRIDTTSFRHDFSQQKFLQRFPKIFLYCLSDNVKVLLTVVKVHIEYFRFDELPKEQSIHFDHRFIFSQSIDCKIMHENLFRIGDKDMIESYQIISVLSDCLILVDSPIKGILQKAVFSKSNFFERES